MSNRCKKCKHLLDERPSQIFYDNISKKSWVQCLGCGREVEKTW